MGYAQLQMNTSTLAIAGVGMIEKGGERRGRIEGGT
jgi:hypothetical protein